MIHRRLVLGSLYFFIWFSVLDAFSIGPSQTSRKHWRARQPHVALAAASSSENDTGVNHVVFEYCTGCRWMTRAFWMAQELLTTFNDDNLSAVTLVPSRPPPGAKFVVSHYDNVGKSTVLWDRASQEGFPEVKELKQLVRDKISPDLFLGHSDNKERQEDDDGASTNDGETEEESAARSSAQVLAQVLEQGVGKPNVAIQYCTGCRWMLRSAYFGTELMTTFSEEINSLTLIPSRPPEKGGVFTVTVNGEEVWDRAEQGGFPEAKELKQIVRDKLAPSKDLGHSDTKERIENKSDDDDMGDDEAADMRAFYGVM